jgi:hypothetical protein
MENGSPNLRPIPGSWAKANNGNMAKAKTINFFTVFYFLV